MAYIVPREIPKSCHECQFHYCSEYHPFWSADKEKRNTQTIRCQAITPFRSTVIDIADKTFKADWCPLADAADVVPKSEVARAICCEIEEEIVAALESNYRAKAERLASCECYFADEVVSLCEGKIAALRGIEGFVEELKKKYTGEQT